MPACPTCQTEFEPRDPRQQCCSKRCGTIRYEAENKAARNAATNARYHQNREAIRAQAKERYRNDPEYRQKYIDYMKTRRETVPDRVNELRTAHRVKPESRARAAAKSREWHSENREYANPRRQTRKQTQRVQLPWHVMVKGAEARAKKAGIAFDLTPEWAEKKWTGRCELTDIPFVVGLRGCGGKLFSPSIDRIIPALGYTQGNCRFVLFCVNIFKFDGSDDDIYRVAEALLARRPK